MTYFFKQDLRNLSLSVSVYVCVGVKSLSEAQGLLALRHQVVSANLFHTSDLSVWRLSLSVGLTVFGKWAEVS